MLVISVLFVLVGGGVGFLVGVELSDLLLAFALGAWWPDFLKAMRGVAETLARVRSKYLLETC